MRTIVPLGSIVKHDFSPQILHTRLSAIYIYICNHTFSAESYDCCEFGCYSGSPVFLSTKVS